MRPISPGLARLLMALLIVGDNTAPPTAAGIMATINQPNPNHPLLLSSGKTTLFLAVSEVFNSAWIALHEYDKHPGLEQAQIIFKLFLEKGSESEVALSFKVWESISFFFFDINQWGWIFALVVA